MINIPFGYFRGRAKRFSFKWLLYIHLPIPLVFLLRVKYGFGYEALPFLLIGAIMGQVAGGKYHKERRNEFKR